MAEMDEQVVSAGLTRRRFLQVTGTTGVAAFLAACGGGLATGTPPATVSPSSASLAPGVTPSPTPQPTPSPTLGGTLHWANWPAYIDLTGAAADAGKYAPGSSPTIVNFQKQTGITVDYQEKIEDNAHFFATIQPQLVAGLSTGWDLIVMTDWMAAKLIAKSWIEKIDQSTVPNCVANLRDPLRNLVWDPGNDYHYPWQSGMTGVGYDSKALTTNNLTPPTSLADLWTIAMAHAKNVSFLTESRDTFGLTMLKLGLDPSKVTVDDLAAGPRRDPAARRCRPALRRQLVPRGLRARQDVGRHGLVGRPRRIRYRDRALRLPDRGCDGLVGQHDDSQGGHEPARCPGDDELRLRPDDRRQHRRLRLLHLAGQWCSRRDQEDRSRCLDESPPLPHPRHRGQAAQLPGAPGLRHRGHPQQPVPRPFRRL